MTRPRLLPSENITKFDIFESLEESNAPEESKPAIPPCTEIHARQCTYSELTVTEHLNP